MNRYIVATPFSLLLLAGCHSTTPASRSEQPAVSAAIFTVVPANGTQNLTLSGVVKPGMEADIASQVMAPVAVVTKHMGDHVRRGEMLVRLHAPALEAGVAQASAAVLSAEQQDAAAQTEATLAADTLTRYQQLRERHSVTPHELEQVEAQNNAALARQKTAASQVKVAQQALAAQRANAADAVLLAPFDGVVTERSVDPGAMASPGTPLLHLQSSGPSEVQFAVPDDVIARLRLGQVISVQAAPNTPTAPAAISNISPAGDASSHSFLVKAVLTKSSAWLAGTVVNVSLPTTRKAVNIVVPVSAVAEQGGLDAVLVVADGHAEVRYVNLGGRQAEDVEVLSGLRAGDRILTDGDLNLAGRRIEVR